MVSDYRSLFSEPNIPHWCKTVMAHLSSGYYLKIVLNSNNSEIFTSLSKANLLKHQNLLFFQKYTDILSTSPNDVIFADLNLIKEASLNKPLCTFIHLSTEKNTSTFSADFHWNPSDFPVSKFIAVLEKFPTVKNIDPPSSQKRGALFLDRDGVIILDKNYTDTPDNVELIPEIVPIIQLANKKNYFVIVITNQSGIGRGFLTESQFTDVNFEMKRQLCINSAWVDSIYYAPYFRDSLLLEGHLNPHFRKPAPGMIQFAQRHFSIDLSLSYLIGNRLSDLKSGLSAKVKNLVLFNGTENELENSKIYFKEYKNFYFSKKNCDISSIVNL